MDIDMPRTFTNYIAVPVRGLTATAAMKIKEALMILLPELTGHRLATNFRSMEVRSNHDRTIHFRFGTTVFIKFTVTATVRQMVLIKQDVDSLFASMSIDYPQMTAPRMNIDGIDPDEIIRIGRILLETDIDSLRESPVLMQYASSQG